MFEFDFHEVVPAYEVVQDLILGRLVELVGGKGVEVVNIGQVVVDLAVTAGLLALKFGGQWFPVHKVVVEQGIEKVTFLTGMLDATEVQGAILAGVVAPRRVFG